MKIAIVGALFGQVIKAMGSGMRIFEYMNLEPAIPNSGGRTLSHLQGRIHLDDVHFRYPSRPDDLVLQRVHLDVPAGKVVALCGPSGSGKSTIGQLIERFYDPFMGRVTLDGVDIRDLDPRYAFSKKPTVTSWVRRNIGYIDQEPVLFAGSIYDNIRYGKPEATKEEVLMAARQANASSFIDSFPDKYDTLVGERGVTLSGGGS